MNILFVHQNMPGQFKHLAPKLAALPKNKVAFITKRENIELPGVRRVNYQIPRTAHETTHHYVRLFENSVIYGQQVVRACHDLAKDGFRPDVIVAHPGWGESLFLKDIYPKVPLLNFCEFYYHGRGADIGFDKDEETGIDDILRARARNAHLLLSLEACDAGLSPTEWQKSAHPSVFHEKIEVIFDGIDTDYIRPDPTATVTLPDGRVLGTDDEVITYSVRNLEPYRGFPNFIRALPRLLELRPNATVLVVGGDEVSYGRAPPDGKSWRETMLEEVPLDLSRVHFLGKLPYANYRSVLQISKAHIYLTRPFVLSWSCIEAMAAGCLIVGSRTPPVEEVIRDGVNGFLVDFHSPKEIAEKTAEVVEAGASLDHIRQRARKTVLDRFALNKCLPRQLKLIRDLAGRG
jgi:glycosyltransferase involved in cell wall biosynthesis